MQVRTDRDTSPGHPIRRFFESVADFLSPTLECSACGATNKQRRCATTGAVRSVEGAAAWPREFACETEHLCPSCGASIWVLETVDCYYPLS
jgi:hypothetical protein